MAEVKTLVIDNFQGSMTPFVDGDINSGLSNVLETFGNDPFLKPGNLTWYQSPVQIDAAGSVITDLILAGKERVESGILYTYAIGHTGRLYKIQSNDPSSFDPNYDNPVLLATLTAETPTFTRGGFIDFFGSTERIYIGHDKGVTRIDFNGANETFVGVLASWTQTVPRPLKQFIGKLYIGNGTNLAEIDSTATVTTYAKLSPGFPSNTQVRDIDVSPAGNYLQVVVTRLALYDITASTQETTSTASSESYIFDWNGTDMGYTSYSTFPSFSLNANIMFGNYQYTFGCDQFGGAIFNPTEKILSEPEVQVPLPNAITSNGNIVSWMAPLYFDGNTYLINNIFGSLDRYVGTGYYSPLFLGATAPETDIIRVPCQILVSNFGLGASSNGYANNQFSTAKVYFSTLETSSGPTTSYNFYKWFPFTSPEIPSVGTPIEGVYQTQTQLFSKKIKVSEVRIYGEPWVADNSFQIDLIGSAGTPITGSSKVFTAGTNLTISDDFCWYTPQMAPTYAIGFRVTNLGTVNHTIMKAEIDYSQGGK